MDHPPDMVAFIWQHAVVWTDCWRWSRSLCSWTNQPPPLIFEPHSESKNPLLKNNGKHTILVVSHSLSKTRCLADPVCALREGGIVQELDREHLQNPASFRKREETIISRDRAEGRETSCRFCSNG